MAHTQIPNPRGAFGYTTADDMRGSLTVRDYHNMSSAQAIPVGAAVVLSSASTDGKGVVLSTIVGHSKVVGIAITSASTGQSTDLSSNAASSAWCKVAVYGGPVMALLSTAVLPGDHVFLGNSTAAGAAGGILQSVTVTTAAGPIQKVVGIAHTSGSTVAENGATQIARGTITLTPSLIMASSLSTVFA